MELLLSIIFWQCFRRAYGEGKFKKILSRTVQTIIAIMVLTYQLAEWNWQAVLIALCISIWVVIQYWSRAIGEIIDAGLNHHQDASSYDRWFRIPLDWIYDKLGKQKYVGFYDFWYSLIRYAIGALPLLYYSWLALLLMPFQYFIYLGCHKLFYHFPDLYLNKTLERLTLNEPKNLAEVIHGALFGLIVGLM
jgi:hypothetical protein